MARVFYCSLLLWLVAASVVQAQQPESSGGDLPSVVNTTGSQEPGVPPNPKTKAEYFEVVRAAIADYEAGRFAEARALFLRAHELWPSARTWRTLGMTAFELSLYPRARFELQQALDDPRRALDEAQRNQVRALLEQTTAYTGRYRVDLTPADAKLRLDGAPVTLTEGNTLWLGVGRHELQAEAPGFSELRVEVVVQGREDEPLQLTLDALVRPSDLVLATQVTLESAPSATEPRPSPDRPVEPADPKRRRPVAQWVVIGSATVLLSAGALMLAAGTRAHSLASAPEDESLSYAEWKHQRELYRRLVGFGGALTGAGALALLAGTWWKLSTRPHSAVLATDGRTLFVRGSF